MTNRSSHAVLSPFEITALRHIANGREAEVLPDHLYLLLAMGLAGLGTNGQTSLTAEGQNRLQDAIAEVAK
jgi:hypothetical protein